MWGMLSRLGFERVETRKRAWVELLLSDGTIVIIERMNGQGVEMSDTECRRDQGEKIKKTG